MTQKRCLNSESLAMRRDVHLRVSRVLTSQSFSTIPDRFGLSHSHPLLSVKLLESCTNQTPSRLTAAALFGGVLGGLSPTLPQPEKRIGDEQPVTCTPPGKKKLRARSPFLIRRGPLDVIDHDVYRGNLRRDELKAKRSQVPIGGLNTVGAQTREVKFVFSAQAGPVLDGRRA